MKHLKLALILLTTIFFSFKQSDGQENRRWAEIDNRLFRIEPDSLYTWQQAAQECKNDHTNLLHPESDYDYTKLRDAIKQNFQNYSSFWTSNYTKFSNVFDHLGLGRNNENRRKCNHFDTTTGGFRFASDDCGKPFGFICERQLLKGHSVFSDERKLYLIQPAKEFTCPETINQCEKNHMSLIALNEYARNHVLRNYVFFNYGSSPHFWLNFNNETHLNCASFKRKQNLTKHTQLGFICERDILKASLSTRHMILIAFLSLAAIGAIFVFIIASCCCFKKESPVVMATEDPRDFKISEIN